MQSHYLSCTFAILALSAPFCLAQSDAPSAPAPQATASDAAGPQLPAVDPANFTASIPTKDDVNGFLKTTWGYDPDRIWEIAGIQKTAAAGISKVQVWVAEKPNPQVGNFTFLVTSDGKHLISQDQVLDFGPRPYDAN